MATWLRGQGPLGVSTGQAAPPPMCPPPPGARWALSSVLNDLRPQSEVERRSELKSL